MKYFFKIKHYEPYHSEKNKYLYECENGKRLVGPPITATANDLIIAELSDSEMTDGYFHIIKIISVNKG